MHNHRVSQRLASVCTLSKVELLHLHGELFKTAPPVRVRKDFLRRIVAYGLQEQELGGLREESRRHLRSLGRTLQNVSGTAISAPSQIKPGTRLIREWNNRTHVVTVGEGDFDYQGSRYESLSEIARTITGTRWSGPLFFGLKNKQVNPSEDRNGG